MPVYYLNDEYIAFPNPELTSEEGILAVGGDYTPDWILLAYQHGIFPWSNPNDPILWWCPDPRFVLFPEELKVSKSMRPFFNQRKFEVTFDTCFEEVMRNCMEFSRRGQKGTWISEPMIQGYLEVHNLGFAHSVEVWKEDELVGGLYGIALGNVFFGESMFSKASNASKFGFIKLVRFLQKNDFQLIDCQQETKHLASLGARSIPRKRFLQTLKDNDLMKTLRGKWKYEE
ncbi:MAG: leucyl/phenylalanyl-tRNA--protein transferase [Bacteroidetes bacterium]|nr:leucyl/phenylalanyl-tRNA--protein transferase [Bacteroidota bacterium]MDF1866468.1 leucyl/phenylalanyl-tRNA--protein transferase [Saprospiraceae bacterium]